MRELALGLAVLVIAGCSGGGTKTVIEAAPRTAADDDADATITAIRKWYPLGQRAAGAQEKSDGCRSDVKGYGKLLDCLDAALLDAASVQAKVGPTTATTPCARDVEERHRRFIAGAGKLASDQRSWLSAHAGSLKPLMAGKTLEDACDAGSGKLCDSMPSVFDDAHPEVSYAIISDMPCTKELFECGPSDNVCFINKVAARVGIGDEARPKGPYGRLVVRPTGRVIIGP